MISVTKKGETMVMLNRALVAAGEWSAEAKTNEEAELVEAVISSLETTKKVILL